MSLHPAVGEKRVAPLRNKGNRAPTKMDLYAGKRLRQIRCDRQVSQEALGKAVNITFQMVQKYEKGVARMSIGMLCKLCNFLGVSPSDFFCDDDTIVGRTFAADPYSSRESIEFLRIFTEIKDGASRNAILLLAHRMAAIEGATSSGQT